MSVRYHSHRNQSIPTYWCGWRPLQRGESGLCQTVHGGALDRAIGEMVIEAMTPLAIEVALTVQQELASRHEEADRLRHQHVERARYEADLAQRRFLKVDPEQALRATNAKFRSRFAHVESSLASAGKTLQESTLDEMEKLWQDAKGFSKEPA